ncbi:MAG TPA: outer membrane beta-barrel protein [Vicinamibacterales bacterium]
MSRLAGIAAAIALLASSSPAWAQSWEASGLAAYTPSVGLDRQAPELSDLSVGGGFTWGLQGARLFTPRWGAEALWMQQASGYEVETEAGASNLFTMTVRQLHGDVLYHFGSANARLRPFVFGGLGATFFSADDLESETKFSFGFGGGIKYFPWNAIGVRAHVRYKPTMLNDEESGDFCDPFGFCGGALHQIEVAAGGVVRF